MHGDRQAEGGKVPGESGQVPLVRMDPAGRHKTHDMRRAAAGLVRLGLERLGEARQCRQVSQAAALDGLIDARKVLQNHAAGAHVHMPDLGVAHLSLGQADL